MTLLEAKEGKEYEIVGFSLLHEDKMRLISLGIYEGNHLIVESKDKSYLSINVNGSKYGLDETVSKDIKVKEV